jgi:hypothetical protein
VNARLGVDQRDFRVVIELSPLTKKVVHLAVPAIRDQPPLRCNGMDRVRVSFVGLAVVPEDDRAHLRHMTGVDQCGLEAKGNGDP